MNKDAVPLLLSVDTASAECGLSRTVFYSRLMRGEIVSVLVGRRRYVPRHALADYIERLEAEQVDGKESADRDADGPSSTRPRQG